MDINLREIEDALNKGQFFLEYQPIMKLEESACVGAEALIRWHRQSRIVQPMEFIPAIENTPLSGPVTYWVIERVAHELGDWLRSTDGVLISINVPPEILGRGGLNYVASKCGLSDQIEKLVIEVSERGVPDRLGIQGLNEGKARGLRVCLDDVGTSDENLVLLTRGNINMVKLDKMFADKMLDPDWSPDLIKGFTAVAQSSSVQVIAEGVETEFQNNTFRDAGIQMAQGTYYSLPLSAADFLEFFQNHKSGSCQNSATPDP